MVDTLTQIFSLGTNEGNENEVFYNKDAFNNVDQILKIMIVLGQNIRENATHKIINGNINCCILCEEQFVPSYRKPHFLYRSMSTSSQHFYNSKNFITI